MNQTHDDELATVSTESTGPLKTYLYAAIFIILLPVAVMMALDRHQELLIFLGLVTAAGLVFYPRKSFWLFLLSIAAYMPYQVGGMAVQPFDIAMVIMIAAIAVDHVLNVRGGFRTAYFDRYFLLLTLATFASIPGAYNVSYCLIPMARIVIIYLAFRAVFKFGIELGVERLIRWYIHFVLLLSLLNLVLYFPSIGEARVFGPAWLTYETYAMTAIPMGLAFFIWADNQRERFRYGLISFVIGLGLVATQSRAPLLAVMITLPVLLWVSYRKARRERSFMVGRSLKMIFVLPLILLAVMFIFKDSIFAAAFERYELLVNSITRPQGTVMLRLLLWSAAIKAFLSNPITGIGIGNFKLIAEIFPEVQMAHLWKRVANMSAHNVFLQYLAETGLLGASALILLAVKGIRTSLPALRKNLSASGNQVSVALFTVMFVFFQTLFYTRDWTWGQGGYLLAFFFGLTAAWRYQQDNSRPESDTKQHS